MKKAGNLLLCTCLPAGGEIPGFSRLRDPVPKFNISEDGGATMSQQYPLVSVVIPSFNRSAQVKRAVLSCLRQTYRYLEVIVVDDASTDGTEAVARAFNNDNVTFLRHEHNRGPAGARNTGIKNARGALVAFLDSDDEWLPEKIERQVETMACLGGRAGLLFTNGYNEEKRSDFFPKDSPGGIIFDPGRDKFYPLRVLMAPPSAWILPAAVIKETGYFDERMYNWDDGDYLARVCYRYPVYFLNENLVIWHASEKHVNAMSLNLIKGKEIFIENNIEFLKRDRDYLFRFYRAMAKDTFSFDKKKARQYLFKALKLKPLDIQVIAKIARSF